MRAYVSAFLVVARRKEKMREYRRQYSRDHKEQNRERKKAWDAARIPCIKCGVGTKAASGWCQKCRTKPCAICGKPYQPYRDADVLTEKSAHKMCRKKKLCEYRQKHF